MLKRAVLSVCTALLFLLLYYTCQISVSVILSRYNPVLLTVIGSALFTAATFAIHRVMGKQTVKEVRLNFIPKADAISLFILGAAFNVVCTVVIALIPFPEKFVYQYSEASAQIGEADVALAAILTLIAAPFTEELLFRGLFFGSLRRFLPRTAATVISGAVFGLAHSSPIWMLYAAFFGCVLAYIYEKHSSLTASIVFHLGFNASGFLSGTFGLPPQIILLLCIPSALYIVLTVVRVFNPKSQSFENYGQM